MKTRFISFLLFFSPFCIPDSQGSPLCSGFDADCPSIHTGADAKACPCLPLSYSIDFRFANGYNLYHVIPILNIRRIAAWKYGHYGTFWQ